MNEAAPTVAPQTEAPKHEAPQIDPPSPSAPGRSRRVFSLALALCLALGGGAYWYKTYGPGAKAAAPNQQRKLPVAVAEAKTQDVEVFLTGLGTVTPLNSITIKSRVDGQLMQVLFREGQQVKAGDLLLVIDPRPFQVQLAQAEGQLKRDTALLENARLDLKRYGELIAQGAIARQQYDTQQSLVHQYEGAVATDKATADNARLQITYCRITAPTSGQVGMRLVDPGNMVRSSDATGLLVLNQLSPINVAFTLPEDQLPRVMAKLRAGEKLRVDVYDREQVHMLAQGELASLDNQIDTTTGTVRLKAVFANTGSELYPNQFVNAKLLLEVMKDAVVIPASAVQRGQQGAYVYVLSAEGTVALRPVSVGEAANGLNAVLSGLAAGEKVVVDGADRLRDGAAVEVKERGAKPEAGKAEGKEGGNAQNATTQAPQAKAQETAAAATSATTNAATTAAVQPEAKSAAHKPEAKHEPKADAPKQEAAKPQAEKPHKEKSEAAKTGGGIAKPEAVKVLTGQAPGDTAPQEKPARSKPDRALVYKPETPGQTDAKSDARTGATTSAHTDAKTSATTDIKP